MMKVVQWLYSFRQKMFEGFHLSSKIAWLFKWCLGSFHLHDLVNEVKVQLSSCEMIFPYPKVVSTMWNGFHISSNGVTYLKSLSKILNSFYISINYVKDVKWFSFIVKWNMWNCFHLSSNEICEIVFVYRQILLKM